MLEDDEFVESALSSYFYVGFGDQNLVSRHVQPSQHEP